MLQKHEIQEQNQKDVNMLIMSKMQLHCIYITSGIYPWKEWPTKIF